MPRIRYKEIINAPNFLLSCHTHVMVSMNFLHCIPGFLHFVKEKERKRPPNN